MQANNILENAKRLGIPIDDDASLIENLDTIRQSLGIDSNSDMNSIERELNNRLEEDNIENLDIPEEEIETLENPEEQIEILEDYPQEEGQKERFGEREYNQTKDDSGEYDPNYYAKKDEETKKDIEEKKVEKNKDTKEVTKKDKNGEPQQITKNKNVFDKAKDNVNLAKAKKANLDNKLNSAKSKIYGVTHPKEALKDKAAGLAKEGAKKAGKAAGKAAANAGKTVGKAVLSGLKSFGMALATGNPVAWGALGVIVIILLLVIILGADLGGGPGVYDSTCDFNQTKIVYTACSSGIDTETDSEINEKPSLDNDSNNSNSDDMNLYEDETENIESDTENTDNDTEDEEESKTELESENFSDYIKNAVYSYTLNDEYTEDQKLALIIALKTNILSTGNYDSTTKTITMDGCNKEELPTITDTEVQEELNDLYNDVYEYLYLDNTFEDTNIMNLSSENSLSINTEDFLAHDGDYEDILNDLYNIEDNMEIYDLSDSCERYETVDGNSYWWPIGSLAPTDGDIYGGPPSTVYISSYFGWRWVNGVKNYHNGLDIAAACDTNVIIATRGGTVTQTYDGCETRGGWGNTCGGKYGNYVFLDHGDGVVTVYAHMALNSLVVSVGDTVQRGEKIGMMGSSGNSTGCHLHFEVRVNNARMNPLEYISASSPRPGD